LEAILALLPGASLATLQLCWLKAGGLSERAFRLVGRLQRLEKLELKAACLPPCGPAVLASGALSSLHTLDCTARYLAPEAVAALPALQQLTRLQLHTTLLLPPAACQLTALGQLQALSLSEDYWDRPFWDGSSTQSCAEQRLAADGEAGRLPPFMPPQPSSFARLQMHGIHCNELRPLEVRMPSRSRMPGRRS